MIVMAASNDLITIFLGLELMSLVALRAGRLPPLAARLERGGAQVLPARRVRVAASCCTASRCSTARPAPRTSRAWATSSADTPLPDNPLLVVGGAAAAHRASRSRSRPCPSTCGRRTPTRARPPRSPASCRRAPRPPASPRCCASCCARWAESSARLDAAAGGARGAHHDGGQRHRAAAAQPQAHAGVLEHRARRLHAGRRSSPAGPRARPPRVFYLAVYSFMNLGAFAVLTMLGRGARSACCVSDLAGLGLPPAAARARDDDVHDLAGRHSADGGLHGQDRTCSAPRCKRPELLCRW